MDEQRMDGRWVNGRTERRVNGWMDTDGWMQMNGGMSEQWMEMDGVVAGRMDGQMGGGNMDDG